MAYYRKEIDNPYGRSSFEDIKKTYQWIELSIHKSFQGANVKSRFLFHLDDVICSVESYSEFVELAYGVKNFEFVSFDIYATTSDKQKLTFHYLTELSVGAEKKELIETIISTLESNKLEELNQLPTSTNVYNDSVVILGNNNDVTNKSTVIEHSATEQEGKQWFRAIGQNLVSNGIWYLLCIAGGAVVTLLLSN